MKTQKDIVEDRGDVQGLAEARASAAMFRALLDAAPDPMVVVDGDGRIVLLNIQARKVFGYEPEELLGQPVELLVPQRHRERHAGHRKRYMREPRRRPMGLGLALFGLRKDGSEFPVEVSLSPIQTAGGMLVTAAIRDITDRRMVETELRASLDEKEVLLKEIHHRVKNNLQIVSSMLNLQLDQLSDAASRDHFKESQTRVRSIALFHEKLYQSKNLARIDIADYLRGLTTDLLTTYGVNPDDVALTVGADDVPLSVDAAISCGLIVNELVSNSLKHAFEGRARGRIRVDLHAENAHVKLEVADNGVGIPADLDFRNPATLGLKLVCIFTEQVGGSIELDRREGTRFVIRFPRGT